MMRLAVLATALALPLAAPAEERLNALEFEQLSAGRTLFFAQNGKPFGAEEYRRNRTVVWSFLGGQCQHGSWREGPDDSICFRYEGDTRETPICWEFFRDGTEIVAREIGADPVDDLTVIGESRAPLPCAGPDVGA